MRVLVIVISPPQQVHFIGGRFLNHASALFGSSLQINCSS